MGVSVIIPTLNVDAHLSAVLRSVADAEEAIVVDGGSTDRTLHVARETGVRVLHTEPGRGRQLHAGALAATQDWLLFLHGDTRLAPDWRAHADRHIAGSDGRNIAGAFCFKLDDLSWQARALEMLVRLRVLVFALPYGDQGLLIHRSFYASLGGFRPLPLMEDVDIVRRIGRRRLRMISCPAVTSARRWRKHGWLARSARNLLCLALFGMGAPIERVARLYER